MGDQEMVDYLAHSPRGPPGDRSRRCCMASSTRTRSCTPTPTRSSRSPTATGTRERIGGAVDGPKAFWKSDGGGTTLAGQRGQELGGCGKRPAARGRHRGGAGRKASMLENCGPGGRTSTALAGAEQRGEADGQRGPSRGRDCTVRRRGHPAGRPGRTGGVIVEPQALQQVTQPRPAGGSIPSLPTISFLIIRRVAQHSPFSSPSRQRPTLP